MNFKCKRGKSLAANLKPGESASVHCSCSLAYSASVTESGTLIVCRDTSANTFQQGGLSSIYFDELRKIVNDRVVEQLNKQGHDSGNVDGGEYIIPASWSNLYKYKGFQGIEPIVTQQYSEPIFKQKAHLEIELYNAVKREDYELAATLRDRIKELEQ